jgi:uncharacterized glyoxalase superfamily protein PhnB
MSQSRPITSEPTAQEPLAVRELVPLLYVEAIDRSLAFYRDKLGFVVTGSWEPNGKLAWCRLQQLGTAIMLQQACDEDGPAAGRGRGVAFFFTCDSAERVYAHLTGRGLALEPPRVAFYGMNQLFVTDPDGYTLCFQNEASAT